MPGTTGTVADDEPSICASMNAPVLRRISSRLHARSGHGRRRDMPSFPLPPARTRGTAPCPGAGGVHGGRRTPTKRRTQDARPPRMRPTTEVSGRKTALPTGRGWGS